MTERLPAGFSFAGVACGIKPSEKPDLSLILCDQAVVAAGVYTKNQFVAAPVVLCRSRTPSRSIRAIVTNSGNANACTGQLGMQNAEEMCRRVASRVGCESEQVLVMSTGVIGQQLPMDCVRSGIDDACKQLGNDADAFMRSAEAILTTDKDRKTDCTQLECGGQSYRIAAMAKGAGMIAPNMATLLAVIMTDAPLTPDLAKDVLVEASRKSFNRVSVDGHTSTNDTLLLLSSGKGDALAGQALTSFGQHVEQLSIRLAKMLVADGEGASHVIALRVHGAADVKSAEIIATTVAASPLVKTAVTGADPNWGRIVSAAGNADARIHPDRTSLKICGQTIYQNGSPHPFDEPALSQRMRQSSEIEIDLQVGDGPGEAEYWSSDLTTQYVQFNSEYTT
jgi:glutamate N-acetyltransferase/amino-acid N-acetyltransferase